MSSGMQPLGDYGGATLIPPISTKTNTIVFSSTFSRCRRKGENFDTQLSLFSRYHDRAFRSRYSRRSGFQRRRLGCFAQSLFNGTQFDGSYRLNDVHTLRAGLGSAPSKPTSIISSTVLPLDAFGTSSADRPKQITDYNAKLGWNIGGYVQDEWKITRQTDPKRGVAFRSIVSVRHREPAQSAPRARINLRENTTLHAGYARYFTPPMQAQATPTNLALFNNTTLQPVITPGNNPVLPERSHYFDVGVDQKICPDVDIGARRLPEVRDRSTRRRTVWPGRRPDPVQLRTRL